MPPMPSQVKEKRLIHQIQPRNVLSFGPKTPALELAALNVLIGPNGSGKSNLIEVVTLMRATAGDIRSVVRRGGGVGEWIWKGKQDGVAEIEIVVANPKETEQPLRHMLSFRAQNQAFCLDDERIDNTGIYRDSPALYKLHYRYQRGTGVVFTPDGQTRRLELGTVESAKSILAELKDPSHYPEVSYLAASYEKIRAYREWQFGRNTIFREPQKADMRTDLLEEDFSNLGLFLNRLRRKPRVKNAILECLRDLYDGFTDFDVSIEGGTVQVFFTEGEFTIPATRLSDGTLRYLCLLAILCDPEPPPLICLEEPELGLHPDILPKVAELLIAASEETQLIVTTHSDILVDALSARPESVVVCEKHDRQTEMRRLNHNDLAEWLKKYKLGQLWTKGQLGGTRW